MAKKSKVILFLVTLVFVFGCANQLPPTGGAIDKIPPEIIETFPLNGTTNFSGNSVELTFSEYVDKRSVQDAIFISPSIDAEIEYDWIGKSLEIIFPENLKPNTTYTITIGTDVVDLNNRNNMANSFTLTFSTGDVIDKNILKGKVYDINPLGTYIFAYKAKQDSIPDISKIKPDYISQVGKSGDFELLGVGKGLYFLVAVKDELRNQLYEKGNDEVGIPSQLYNVNSIDTVITGINFFISVEDTIPPSVSNVAMIDKNHFLIDISEQIDSSSVSKNNFIIVDSTQNKSYPISGFFKNRLNQFYLGFNDSLKSENLNYLISQNLVDLVGNKSSTESFSFSVNAKPDTTKPRIKSIETEYTNNKVDFSAPYFHINFDDAIIINGLSNVFSIKEIQNSERNFSYSMIDDSRIKLIYKGKLNQKSNYTLLIDTKQISDIAGNKMDSIYSFNFVTNNELDFGGISGKVTSESKNIVVELQNIPSRRKVLTQVVDSTATFNFTRIKPGKYFLIGIEDKDNSNSHTKGTLKPFSFSEKFQYYPDTLNVRARWPIGDINLKLN